MTNFSDFYNTSVYDVLRYGQTISRLVQTHLDSSFTRKQFGEAMNGAVRFPINFDSLREHGFVKVQRTEIRNVYTAGDSWNREVIDMTDEQYDCLPDYFKKQVEVQTRKVYYYVLDIVKCHDFMKLATAIGHAFNGIEE